MHHLPPFTPVWTQRTSSQASPSPSPGALQTFEDGNCAISLCFPTVPLMAKLLKPLLFHSDDTLVRMGTQEQTQQVRQKQSNNKCFQFSDSVKENVYGNKYKNYIYKYLLLHLFMRTCKSFHCEHRNPHSKHIRVLHNDDLSPKLNYVSGAKNEFDGCSPFCVYLLTTMATN